MLSAGSVFCCRALTDEIFVISGRISVWSLSYVFPDIRPSPFTSWRKMVVAGSQIIGRSKDQGPLHCSVSSLSEASNMENGSTCSGQLAITLPAVLLDYPKGYSEPSPVLLGGSYQMEPCQKFLCRPSSKKIPENTKAVCCARLDLVMCLQQPCHGH